MGDKDIWTERLGIHCGGYNAEVDDQILAVAKLIVDGREDRNFPYYTKIAEELDLSPSHVELILYILASVKMEGCDPHGGPFIYGTAPRGLFVSDWEVAKQFIREFDDYYAREWGDDDETN